MKLNAAYSKQADLGELLRKHRLLALGRAPVKDRLLLLRTIAKRDPNDVWDKDMVELEFVRLGEIKMEVKRLANLQDAHQIHQLYNEVTANNWHVRVPLELLGDLGHLKDEVDVKSAREELVSIASELSHAHARGNVRSGRENREEWNKQLKLANLPKDHPSRKLPLTALSWLKDEDAKEDAKNQFRAQQVRFKAALDDDASQAVLQQQHEALVGSGFKLNPDLANEYEERIGDFKFAKRRKVISEFVTFLILTSIVAVIGYFAIKWALDQQIRESGVKE